MYKPIPGRGNRDRDRAITLKVLEGVSVNKMAKRSKLSVQLLQLYVNKLIKVITICVNFHTEILTSKVYEG
jgi:hypothetical protein